MAQLTYLARKGEDANFAALAADSLTLAGAAVDTAVLLGSGQVVDLNGEADALIMDAAQAVRLDGSTAGTLKVKISGAYDFQITANTLTAISGSTIATNTIAETTAASGVTIDSLLVKDGGATVGTGGVVALAGQADALTLDADGNTSLSAPTDNQIDVEINGADDFTFTANTFTALSGSTIATNTIAETTAASGVTVDGVLLKDTAAYGRTPVVAVTADGAIAIPAYNAVHFITKAGVAAMTIADPTSGTHDGVTLTFVATTASAHTLDNSAGSGFFSSGGAGKDVATFGGAIGDGLTIIAYQGKWYIDPRGVTNVTLA